MKMLISSEWLKKKIDSEPEETIGAGNPEETLKSIRMFCDADITFQSKRDRKIKMAFGMFVRNSRLQQKLSVEQLAEKAGIDDDEVNLIESDISYQPRPRTITHLATCFNVNNQRLMEISGALSPNDDVFEEEVLKFAAKSKGVSSLNKEERSALNEFVKFLNEK